MAILYAVVARGTVILAEFSAVTGNTGAVARRILEKLPNEADSRLCFSQERYIFHILRSDDLTFLCMANDTFGRKCSLLVMSSISAFLLLVLYHVLMLLKILDKVFNLVYDAVLFCISVAFEVIAILEVALLGLALESGILHFVHCYHLQLTNSRF